MKRFILIGLSILSFINVSAQSSDEIIDIGLSYEFAPVELSDEFMENLEDPDGLPGALVDSVIVSTYFTVTNLVGLQGITCQLSGKGGSLSETYFPFEAYGSDYESGLYRKNNYFITQLGQYVFSDDMLVRVKLKYTDRETPYYSGSVNK